MEIFVNREIIGFVLIFSHPAEQLRSRYWSKKTDRLFVQSSRCDERIESFASPPHIITLLNFKCKWFLHGSTVEPRYNEVPAPYDERFSVPQ